jgi:hypothetical protein
MTATDTQGTLLFRNGVEMPNVKSMGAVGLGGNLRNTTTISDDIAKFKPNLAKVPQFTVVLWYDPQQPLHQDPMREAYATESSGNRC